MEDVYDRPRGVLTEADRRYLLGESDLTHEQSRRNTEARIRERVVNSVLDFALLAQFLKGKDRRQVFEKNLDDEEFEMGLIGMLSLSYVGTKESGEEFESYLVPAIRLVEQGFVAAALGTTADVSVDLDVDLEQGTDLDELAWRVADYESITTEELYALLIGAPEHFEEVEFLTLRLGESDLGFDESAFVARLAEFLDADLEWLDDDRVRLEGLADSFAVDPPISEVQ